MRLKETDSEKQVGASALQFRVPVQSADLRLSPRSASLVGSSSQSLRSSFVNGPALTLLGFWGDSMTRSTKGVAH